MLTWCPHHYNFHHMVQRRERQVSCLGIVSESKKNVRVLPDCSWVASNDTDTCIAIHSRAVSSGDMLSWFGWFGSLNPRIVSVWKKNNFREILLLSFSSSSELYSTVWKSYVQGLLFGFNVTGGYVSCHLNIRQGFGRGVISLAEGWNKSWRSSAPWTAVGRSRPSWMVT